MDFAKYAAYRVTDFLADDDFIDGVLQPTAQTALFWSRLAERYPAQQANLAQAAAILRSYRQQDTFADATIQDELWQRIAAEVGPAMLVAARLRARRWPTVLRVAAAVIPLGVGSFAFWYSQDQQVRTAYGEIKTVDLADGTQVVLNGNSSLTYQRGWGHRTRQVWLRGEGFFRVAHLNQDTAQVQPGERFVVHCRGLNVEVLGTTFNVNDRPGKVNVGLVTGKIRLTTALPNQPPTALTLAPGDYVEYAARRISAPRRLAHPEHLTTWSRRQFSFTNARLGDILKTLQDAYGYQVTYAHPEAANLQIEGEINVAGVAELLETVSASLHVRIAQQGHHLVVN
ncbi:FecR family protein [Hymenobacter bucti]|uniref:FecR family protein n=1 Tax=Hymenobacter bucti TaxID=1844114 RepID=A0ABW4QUC8_9BACT